jgi:hypothetical protein
MQRYSFDDKHAFVAKVEELVRSGVPKNKIDTFTPYVVHESAHLLEEHQSAVRFFQGGGGLAGFITGWAFTIFTVFHWASPMITGGKPYVSIPAFLIIAYELTILFGCLGGFVGFLYLARMPVISNIFSSESEFGTKFEIEVKE